MWGPGFPQFPPPLFLSQSIEACVRFVMASYKVPTVSFFKHIRVGYTHLSMLLFPWFFCWLASSASYRALAILEYILCQIFCEVTIWGLVQLVPGAATHTAVTPSPPPIVMIAGVAGVHALCVDATPTRLTSDLISDATCRRVFHLRAPRGRLDAHLRALAALTWSPPLSEHATWRWCGSAGGRASPTSLFLLGLYQIGFILVHFGWHFLL